MPERSILDPIPRTQHRPITITIRSPVIATHCPFRRRFNLKKANWSKFTNEIYQAIANIPAHPNHYNDFVDLVKKAARHNIPRGCQKEYIPGLSDESSDLLKLYDEEYNKDPLSESTIQLGDTLLDEISGERLKIWRDMVENTNLTLNSITACADNVSPPVVTTVTADQIANQLLSNGRRVEHRRPPGEHHKTIVPSNNQPPTELNKPFSLDELATGLSLLKAGKAAGLDGLLTEMLQHLGNKAKSWLLDMLNECTSAKHIPSIWRKAKVIAIPKPGKDPSSPKSNRPISLLCIPYTLYERLILMRISPLVDEKLTKDQAGFRPGRSCAGLLLNLTQHIEDGYERKMLTGVAVVDLSAAYDTVQHRIMIS